MCPISADIAGGLRTLLVIGLGNIGAILVSLLRSTSVDRVILIDPDLYRQSNLQHQAIGPAALGRQKAEVQAELLRELRPDLEVVGIARRVEEIPLGQLRARAAISCVDSRRARQHINEIVTRLAIPLLLDTGVRTEASLARVTSFTPAARAPCLECSWGELDYRHLEVRHLCSARGEADTTPSTQGSPALGALAASLAAIRLELALRGELTREELDGRDLVVDARSGQFFASTLRRQASCRFDHESWTLRELPVGTRLPALVDSLATAEPTGIALHGELLVDAARCPSCGTDNESLWLHAAGASCPCGAALLPLPGAIHEMLPLSRVSATTLASLSLERLAPGSVLTVFTEQRGALRYELAPARPRTNPLTEETSHER